MRLLLSGRERTLILSKDICRLSTMSRDGWPHVVPVGYVYLRGKFYVPSMRRASKIRNLERNARATIVIDEERTERGVMIKCQSRVLNGEEAELYRKYMHRKKGWKNDERTVIIELVPLRKASWFLR